MKGYRELNRQNRLVVVKGWLRLLLVGLLACLAGYSSCWGASQSMILSRSLDRMITFNAPNGDSVSSSQMFNVFA